MLDQARRAVPMPAQKNMATQLMRENSGRASGPPNRTLEYFPNARNSSTPKQNRANQM